MVGDQTELEKFSLKKILYTYKIRTLILPPCDRLIFFTHSIILIGKYS